MIERPRYWFPAKRIGWGWGPPTCWQGWLCLLLWTAAVVAGNVHLTRIRPPDVLRLQLFNLLMIALLLSMCWFKGEPPRWRSGSGRDQN